MECTNSLKGTSIGLERSVLTSQYLEAHTRLAQDYIEMVASFAPS